MMKKKISFLLCFITLIFGACAAPTFEPASSVSSASGQTVTFTDDLGRTVTVDSPRRVAALIGSFAEVWCLAGGKDQLVATADDAWTQFELDLSQDVVSLGATKEINAEQILAADPDFVIASCNTAANVEFLETFEKAGLNAAYFQVSTFEEYLHMLDICTQITGYREYYESRGLAVREQVDDAKARQDGSNPTVLYIRASGSGCKIKNSEDSVLGEMLADLGCTNIADSEETLLENLNMEVIVQCDPTYIFVVMQGEDQEKLEKVIRTTLLDDPAWQGLSAVRNSNLYMMDQRLYNLKPNVRWGEAYAQLADILYPEE